MGDISEFHFHMVIKWAGFLIYVDCFADETNDMVIALLYSWHLCPGTARVNGFVQRWINENGKRMPIFWFSGLFQFILGILQKIGKSKPAASSSRKTEWAPRQWCSTRCQWSNPFTCRR